MSRPAHREPAREFYYADFNITVNTHRLAKHPGEFEELKLILMDAVQVQLADTRVLRRIFNPALVQYNRYPAHVERGKRVPWVHIHFNATLKARQPFVLNGIQRRLQDFLSDVTGIPGLYVRAGLTQRAKRLNYVAKKAQALAVRSAPRRFVY